MSYEKLLANISIAVEAKFNDISTRYNFDYGDEFEIAICELLQSILPNKYGICRGFILTENDSYIGDDIIIYDRDRFPTIRLLDNGKFDKKQEIPIEAVYAYIEAKHSLVIGNKTNISTALQQVSNYKRLPREKRDIATIDHYVSIKGDISITTRPDWPTFSNPHFGVIVSRNLKFEDGRVASYQDLVDFIKSLKVPDGTISPDLIIAGEDSLFIAAREEEDKSVTIESPFIHDKFILHPFEVKSHAFSIGIVNILHALDNIRLHHMPYLNIIGKGIRSKKTSNPT